MSTAKQPHRIFTLDGIRGIAILLVLLAHTHHWLFAWLPATGREAAKVVSDCGWLGVDVFFVLSGFLITSILISIRKRQDFWSYFYIRRFFRIVPVVLWVCIPIGILLIARHHLTVLQWLLLISPFANWQMIRSNAGPQLTHMWSLAVEEQFYFVWPFLIRALSVRRAFWSAMLLAVGSLLAHLIAASVGISPIAIYKSTPTHLFGIALGSAIAAAMREQLSSSSARKWMVRMLCAGSALLVTGPIVAWEVFGRLGYPWDLPWVTIFGISGMSLVTGALVMAAAREELPKSVARFLCQPWLLWFGRRSYAIYLVHVVLNYAATVITQSLALQAAIIFGCTALLVELSWRFVESPALALGARLTGRREVLLEE